MLAPVSFLLMTLLMSEEAFLSYGWRIPFLASILLVGVGLWMRLKMDETPVFKVQRDRGVNTRLPFVEDLAHVVAQARVVRLMLATPLERGEPPLLHETPWGRRARCDQYDLALCDARRALWEWLLLFRRLGERDRHFLLALGVSVAPFYDTLFRPGVFDRSQDPWEETLYPEAPDHARVYGALRRTMHDLRCFELALLGAVHDPYRR